MVRKFTGLFRTTQTPRRKKRRQVKFDFEPAPHIVARVKVLLRECNLDYMDEARIFCVESIGSKSRAYARIWGLPRIWQTALDTRPAYILEVTEKFLKLSPQEQDRVLLHELAHVPKNFSGALVGHYGIEKRIQQMERQRRGK